MSRIPLRYVDDRYNLTDYVDLREWQDDKTVLANPHKGWYWHYIDNGLARGAYRDRTDKGDDMRDFPGLNHLYLRFDWGDIEQAEGVRDWSAIDSIIEEWGARGYKFALRLCTYEASGAGALRYATPKWVYDAGAKYTQIQDRIEPDYGDEIYLAKLTSFMRAYGEKYNRHPLIETVDVGTFGTWGEGHTYMGSDRTFPYEVMVRHFDLHTRNFPDKVVLMNDDFVGNRAGASNEECLRLIEYARRQNAGLRDDSICVESCCEEYGYDSVRAPHMFDVFWRQAPIDIEFEHYHTATARAESWRSGLPVIEALRRTHATYAGFHGYPRPWLERYSDLTRYLANRLGYWYFIEGAQLPPLTSGVRSYIEVIFENRGFAPAYDRYELKVRFEREGERVTQAIASADNRRWMPGEISRERFLVDARSLNTGKYSISIGLFEGERAIKLGVAAELEKDGFYRLGEIEVV